MSLFLRLALSLVLLPLRVTLWLLTWPLRARLVARTTRRAARVYRHAEATTARWVSGVRDPRFPHPVY
jgi:hypothetical protein